MRSAALSLADECRWLRARFRALALRQQEVAQALGVSQAQISRILAGRISRRSRVMQALSIYVQHRSPRTRHAAVTSNKVLQEALMAAWDGTPSHADALALLIKAAAALRGG